MVLKVDIILTEPYIGLGWNIGLSNARDSWRLENIC